MARRKLRAKNITSQFQSTNKEEYFNEKSKRLRQAKLSILTPNSIEKKGRNDFRIGEEGAFLLLVSNVDAHIPIINH